jgi:hypothetical protein
MKIIFSKHALLKINHRNLHKVQIIETIKYPDFTQPSYNFREERYRLYTKNHLKVVIKIERESIVVVTAHWVAKPKLK